MVFKTLPMIYKSALVHFKWFPCGMFHCFEIDKTRLLFYLALWRGCFCLKPEVLYFENNARMPYENSNGEKKILIRQMPSRVEHLTSSNIIELDKYYVHLVNYVLKFRNGG